MMYRLVFGGSVFKASAKLSWVMLREFVKALFRWRVTRFILICVAVYLVIKLIASVVKSISTPHSGLYEMRKNRRDRKQKRRWQKKMRKCPNYLSDLEFSKRHNARYDFKNIPIFNDEDILENCNALIAHLHDRILHHSNNEVFMTSEENSDIKKAISFLVAYESEGQRCRSYTVTTDLIIGLEKAGILSEHPAKDYRTILRKIEKYNHSWRWASDVADFLEAQKNEDFEDTIYIHDILVREYHIPNVIDFFKTAGNETIGEIASDFCRRALASDNPAEISRLGRAAMTLSLGVCIPHAAYSLHPLTIKDMAYDLCCKTMITPAIKQYYFAYADALSAKDADSESLKTVIRKIAVMAENAAATPKEIVDGSSLDTAAPYSATEQPVSENREKRTGDGYADSEKESSQNSSKIRDMLENFISCATENYKNGNYIEAATYGRYFIEEILKEYCQAAGIDRTGTTLLQQIDDFKGNGMLEEKECSILHSIRIISNKGVHRDEGLTRNDVCRMTDLMKAEMKLFGIL